MSAAARVQQLQKQGRVRSEGETHGGMRVGGRGVVVGDTRRNETTREQARKEKRGAQSMDCASRLDYSDESSRSDGTLPRIVIPHCTGGLVSSASSQPGKTIRDDTRQAEQVRRVITCAQARAEDHKQKRRAWYTLRYIRGAGVGGAGRQIAWGESLSCSRTLTVSLLVSFTKRLSSLLFPRY